MWAHLRYSPETRSPSFLDGFVDRLPNGKFSPHPAIRAMGLGLLPRWDLVPLIMPGFAGRTLVGIDRLLGERLSNLPLGWSLRGSCSIITRWESYPRISPCASTRRGVLFRAEAKGENMAGQRIDLPQGTLDLLILRTFALGPQHGWAVSERVQQMSSDILRIQQGSLYPALHRLERRGGIKAKWGTSDNNRRAKYYELTKAGHRQLEVEKDAWEKLTNVEQRDPRQQDMMAG